MSAGATANTLWTTPLYANLGYRYNNNLYYYGNGVDISLERELVQRLTGRMEWGWEANQYLNADRKPGSQFVLTHGGASLSYWWNDWSFGSGVELWNTDSGQEIRWMLDTSFRLRSVPNK